MVMALVAILGAVTAYRATQNELGASACGRKLDEEQMLGLVKREELLGKLRENARWDDEYRFHVGQGQLLLQHARSLRVYGASPSGYPSPDALDIQAQVEFAIARQLKPLRDFTNVSLGSGKLEQALTARVARELERFGLGDRCVESGVGRSGSATLGVDYAKHLKADAEAVEDRAVHNAIAIVGFVLALVFFTLSEVTKLGYKSRLEALGYAAALTALGTGVWVDHGLSVYYVITIFAFAALAAIGWTLVLRLKGSRTSEVSDEPPGEAPDFHLDHVRWRIHIAPSHHPFGAVTLIGISLVALSSALSTVGYSDAITHARRAAAAALDHQVIMFRENTRRHAAALSSLDTIAFLQERATHIRAAQQASTLSRLAENRPDDQMFWRLEYDRWEKLIGKLLPKDTDRQNWFGRMRGPNAPDTDPYFPERAVYNLTIPETAKEFALWDSADALSLVWGQKASHYLASLTLFAIALYLFGQSLGMGRTRGALILVFFGCLLLVGGVALGIQGLRQPLPTSGGMPVPAACKDPDEQATTTDSAEVAARCYARGQLLEAVARTDTDYAAARDAYREAVKARPDFSVASLHLASMAENVESPQASARYPSVIGNKSLKTVVSARKTAIDYMRRRNLRVSASMLGSYAFARYMQALANGDRGELRRSIDDTKDARQLDKANLLLHLQYNLGVAYLADNQVGKAQDMYDAATGAHPQSELALGAITDLEILRAICPRLAGARWYNDRYCQDLSGRVDRLKSSLVQAAWGTVGKSSVGVPQKLTIGVSLAGVGWHAHQGFANAGTGHILAVLWYQKDPRWGWYALSEESYQVDQVDPSDLDDGHGGAEHFQSHLRATNYERCLQPGSYRVEFYLDGKLVATADPEPQMPEDPARFQVGAFRDLGLAMCYPRGDRGWVRWHPSRSADLGLVAGYSTEDRTRGALLFGYVYPRRSSDAAEIERSFIRQAITLLQRESLVHGTETESPVGCDRYWDNWGKPHVQYVFRGYPRIAVLAKAWTGSDGLVHVGVVWRPLPLFPPATDDDLSCRLLTSITAIDSDVPNGR